ncbi:MAG: hypothetical protein Q8P75_02840, partial [bacterium]|nr:hypothetical protein [bacterium]
AQALQKYDGVRVTMFDVNKFYEGPFVKSSTAIYIKILKYIPWLWGFFYTNRFFQALSLPLRIPFASFKIKKFRAFFEKEKPDLILCTHPAGTALVSYLKKTGEYQGPLVVSFSDFHFQPFWIFPRVDRYLVMTPEQKQQVASYGFAPQRIIVTGLPVNEVFSGSYQEADVAKEFGLLRTKPVIVIMGGSRGWGIRLPDIEAVLASEYDVQAAVITGTDERLKQEVKRLGEKYPGRLTAFSNLSNEQVAKLFAIAKILVTKPGGLSIAQALLRGLPMVLVNPLPAMEELNQDYLIQRGIAVVAKTPAEVRSWTERLLRDKKMYSMQKANMKRLYFPNASAAAARAIIDMFQVRY